MLKKVGLFLMIEGSMLAGMFIQYQMPAFEMIMDGLAVSLETLNETIEQSTLQ